MTAVAPAPAGWSSGVARKLAGLSVGRLVTQVLAIGWFLLAARLLGTEEFGLLASGLATFGVVTILGDAGTTWSLPRHIAGRPGVARAAYRRAVVVRLTGVVVTSVPLLVVARMFVEADAWWAMVLGSIVALASGLAEVGYATLRSLALVRAETVLLPAERIVFVGAGVAAIAAGAGAHAILLLYVATNAVAALVVASVVLRCVPPQSDDDLVFWDGEARRTGIAFALVALGPRVNAVVLVMMATASDVADYAAASRPVEQVALVVIGFASQLLPVMREDVVAARDPARRATVVVLPVTVLLLPAVVWMCADPAAVVELLYGAGRYPGAAEILALVALATVTWAARAVLAMVMIAEERAGRLARVSLAGVVANLALAVALGSLYGSTGVAAALLISEVATLLLLVAHVGVPADSRLNAPVVAGLAVGVLGVLVVTAAGFSTPATVLGLGVVGVICGALAVRVGQLAALPADGSP